MQSMLTYAVRRIGLHRGSPRVWLQGREPSKGGFHPGSRFNVQVDREKSTVVLEVANDGVRLVSAKSKGDRTIPVIDLNSRELLQVFDGMDAVRVVVEAGRISLLPLASEVRAQRRTARLRRKLLAGEPISVGTVASGVGILDGAAHAGMAAAGLVSQLAFFNEVREDCVDHMVDRNPVVGNDTIHLQAPMQELAFDSAAMARLPEVDLVIGGIPCSGASRAGKAQRGSSYAEAHPEVGHLVVAFLAIIAKVNPAAIVLENVVPWAHTASMCILRNQLRDLGYDVHDTTLKAGDWNLLEHRDRLCVVAVTRGLTFRFDGLERPTPASRMFAEIMDDVPLDADCWSPMSYLKEKRRRDEASGSNFKMTIVGPESPKLATLTKTLWKRQSTGNFIQHPLDPELLRLPTVAEHARAKGVDLELVRDVGMTFGHEVLGQSVSVPPFIAVFKHLGQALMSWASASASHRAAAFCLPVLKAA
ncbi:DNA cytosine methyltransferase [Pelomonas sp. HMWF004]|nr:DNA cytosine methyltransferase [Pelomonas sp. HMWF004]